MATRRRSVYIRPQKPLPIRIRRRTLKGSLEKIQAKKIKFDKDINILALEQSIGKTHRCIKYIKENHENQKIIYLTNKHDKLNEIETELKRANITYRHWYGFSTEEKDKGCPKLDERGRKDLYKKVLSPSIICRAYNCKTGCRYQDQFKTLPNVVLAPTPYIGTKYVTDFKPDIMFIDESINTFTELKRNLKSPPVIKKSTIEGYIVRDLRKGNRNIDKWIEMLKFIELEDKFPNHPYDKAWYPHIYHVFDFSKTIPIVLMDATFEMSLFEYFLNAYKHHQRRLFKPSIKAWYSEVENKKDSTIFVPFPTWGFYKSHFWKQGNPPTKKILKQIQKQMIKLAIDPAFITYGGFLDYFPPFKTCYFGALSGLNEFEDCDVLVVAGTFGYGPEQGQEVLKKIFNDSTLKVDLGKKEPFRPYKTITVKGKKHPNYPILQAENDQWDAIMRIRPYKRKKYVILLGYIAKRFEDKLNYTELPKYGGNPNLEKVLAIIEDEFAHEGAGIDLMKAWNIMVDLDRGIGCERPNAIAKKNKIPNRNEEGKTTGGYDTKRIEELWKLLPKIDEGKKK